MKKPDTLAASEELGSWRVRQSRVVHRDHWITLRADDCVTPRGSEIAPFYVLEYPDFVHAIAVTPSEDIVLVRQYRHGSRTVTVELPGGAMDATDRDVETTAARELLEETGYTGVVKAVLPARSIDPSKLNNRLWGVIILEAVSTGYQNLDPGEDIDVVCMPLVTAVEMAIDGRIFNAGHSALLLLGLHAVGKLTWQPSLRAAGST